MLMPIRCRDEGKVAEHRLARADRLAKGQEVDWERKIRQRARVQIYKEGQSSG